MKQLDSKPSILVQPTPGLYSIILLLACRKEDLAISISSTIVISIIRDYYIIIGICVKTRTVAGEKVFINICVSDKIPAPEDISDIDLFKIIDDEETTYTIPMSIGSERMEMDKCNKKFGFLGLYY